MKRVLSLFLSCIFVLGVCFSTPIVASATKGETIASGEYTYTILSEEAKTCALTKYTGAEKNITIADSVLHNEVLYTVTQVNAGTFKYIEKNEDGERFVENTTITSIKIPANVEKIEDGAFSGCSALATFVIAEDNNYNNSFSVVNGVLFNKDSTKLIAYPAAKADTEYTIPSTVTEIALGAFEGSNVYLYSERTDATGVIGFNDLKIHYGYDVDSGFHHLSGKYVAEGTTLKDFCVVCEKEVGTATLSCEDIEYNGRSYDESEIIGTGTLFEAIPESFKIVYTKGESIIDSPIDVGEYGAYLSVSETEITTNTVGFEIASIDITGAEIGSFTDMVYTGNAQTPQATVTKDGLTVTGSWSPVTNVEDKTEFTANGNFKGTISSVDTRMQKATPEIEVVAAKNLVFTNEAQSLIESGITTYGTLKYSLENSDDETKWSEDIPKGTAPREYTVYYKVVGNENVIPTIVQSIKVTISSHEHAWKLDVDNEKATIKATCSGEGLCEYKTNPLKVTLIAPTDELIYDATAKEASLTAFENETGLEISSIVYTSKTDGVKLVNGKCINAGDYTASVTLNDGEESASVSVDFTIEKASIEGKKVTLNGVEDLKYNGNEQKPISVEVEGLTENTDYTVSCSEDVISAGEVTVTVKGKGNYTGKTQKTYKINKAEATFTVPEAKTDLVYNGFAQELVIVDTAMGGELQYRLNENESWGSTVPTAIDVGTYTVQYMFVVDSNHTYTGEDVQGSVEIIISQHEHNWAFEVVDGAENKISATCQNAGCKIEKTTIELDVPTNLVYDGIEKGSSVFVSAENTGIQIPEIEYSGDRVNVTEDGYTASIILGEGEKAVTATINLKITPKSLADKAYVNVIESETYMGSEIKPTVVVKDEETVLSSKTDYDVVYSDNIDVGSATVKVTFKGNYEGTVIANFVITKAQAVITPPTANTTLTYTGEKQELLATAGLTTFGEIEYSLDNENWVKTIPTAKEAGKYVVYYRVVGSDNYNGATGSLAVTIKAHEHDWKYSASGAVITATCSGEGLCNINETTIALEKNNKANFVYDGTEKTNLINIVCSEELKQALGNVLDGVSVVYSYDSQVPCTVKNAGEKYSASVTLGEQTATLPFIITEKKLTDNNVTITGIEDSYVYTDSAIEPSIVVKDGATVLSSETDYDVSYSNNTDVGTATVTITFKGNYSGTVERTFKIVEHVHSWSFEVIEDENGNKISATCESCPDFTECVTITLEAPEIPDDATSLIYDGSVKEATVTDDSEENIFENTKITYESKSVNEDDEAIYSPLEDEDLPTNAGTYRASITLGEETVSVEFTIGKATLTITVENKEIYVNHIPRDFGYESTGLVQGDTINLTLVTDFNIDDPQTGTYPIKLSGEIVVKNGEDKQTTNNYTINFNEGTLTVVECPGHTGGTATCMQKAECAICFAKYGDYGEHNWGFTANGSVITATCLTEDCIDYKDGYGVKINLKEKESLTYTGDFIEKPVEFCFEDAGIEDSEKERILGLLPEIVYTGNLTGEKIVNTGNYTATVTIDEDQIATLLFTISPKQLTDNEIAITGIENSYVYTGTDILPEISLTDNEKQLVSGTDYTVNYSDDIINAGTVTVTVTGIGNYTGEVKETYTIEPKEITATLTQDSGVYNGNAHQPTVKISGLCGTETLTNGTDFSVEYSDNINVGTVTVTVTLKETSVAKNYTFANNAKTTTLNYTITAGVASIKTAPTVVKTGLVYTGSAQELVTAGEATNGTMQYRLSENESWSTTIPSGIDAKTYTVYYKVKGDLNYSDSDVASVDVAIAKATPTIDNFTVTLPKNLNYDGDAKTAVVVVEDGVTGMGDVTVKYYLVVDGVVAEDGSTVAPTNAGTYKVKVDVAGENNYADATELTCDEWQFTIGKAQVDITAPTINNLTYTGSAQVLLATAGSATFGEIEYSLDEKNWSTTIPTATEKGEYTVYYRVQGTENYDGANGSVEVTIEEHKHDWKFEASDAIITATCQNTVGCDINKTIKLEVKAPENLVYDGEKKEVTYTITEGYKEVFGDEITVSYIGDKIEQGKCINKGDYTAVVKAQGKNATLDFSITPRTIIITDIEGLERVYDGTTKVDLSTATKVVYTNGIDGKPIEFDLSKVTATATKADVGDAVLVTLVGDVTVKGDENSNYQCSVLDDNRITVKITPATVTITPNAKSSEQYYNLPALDYEVTGLIGKDELTKAPTLTTTADIKTVGNYTITASGAEASANYKITYAPATLTITEHKNHIVKDGTWKETVHGTCMVVGKEAGTCTLCSGTVTRDSKTDPNNHKLITKVIKHETCTQDGEALVTCANGCSYSLKTALPADGKSHSFAKDFTVIESTCVAKGVKYKVCQNPNCKVVTEKTEIAINPDAHTNLVTINIKESSCEEKGYTGDKVCNDCKKVIDPGIETNAKGHTESDWIVDKEATFTEEGAKHTACTVCKKELKKEVIAKRALETPEVKIENVSNGIKVSWSQDEDAAGYTVYSSTYNAKTKKWSAWKNRGTAAATKSSWTDKVVTEGVTYRYTVRSVNGTNRSAYKATQGLRYVSTPKVTVSITSTGLLAKWNKVNNATSYTVYRAELNSTGKWNSWIRLGTTTSAKNTWNDAKVQSGVTYKYTVRAVVGKVNSGYTASSSIIYLAQPNLKIENAANGIIGKWSSIAGATGYTIYRSEYNASTKKWSSWLNLGTTKATAKSFTDKTAKSGVTYKYTIRAINGKLKSTYQDSNKLVYLAQPTLTISNVANGIQGKWNQVNGATGYIIYRSELKDGKWTSWTNLGTTKATTKSFTDKTVKSGVTYKYTIRAKNGNYKSSYVSTSSLVFLAVPTVKISSGITGVNVSWSKIEGATSYLVYRREVVNGKWSNWSVLKTVTETSIVDETAKSGTQYRYTVRALSGKSKSVYTSTGTLNYLATPTVKAEKVTDGIKVNWTQVAGVTGYTIYRAELVANGKWSKWVTLGTASANHSSCKDKTAKANVTYKYTVRAVNGKVKSAYVSGAQVTN